MSHLRNFAGAAAATLAFFAVAAAAKDAGEWAWLRAAPSSGAYSVELPCSVEEVDLQTALAVNSQRDVLVRDRLDRAARSVTCIQGGAVFSAQLVSVADSEPLVGNVYDVLLDAVRPAAQGRGLEMTETLLAGRRALITQEIEGANVGRTGVVELSARSYLLLIGGAEPARGPVPSDFLSQLDRFFASVEIANS